MNQWYNQSQAMASTLLSIVSVGLILAYSVLFYNMRTYFKEQMGQERFRLSILFATFVSAYTLRLVYQIFLGEKIYTQLIEEMVVRWQIINALPLVWDITSILSILILHHMSFRRPHSNQAPKAGHYNANKGLPDFDENTSFTDSMISSAPCTIVRGLVENTETSSAMTSRGSHQGLLTSPKLPRTSHGSINSRPEDSEYDSSTRNNSGAWPLFGLGRAPVEDGKESEVSQGETVSLFYSKP